jgi:hypothetical protein
MPPNLKLLNLSEYLRNVGSKFINHNIMVGAGLPIFLVSFTDVGEPASTAISAFSLLYNT